MQDLQHLIKFSRARIFIYVISKLYPNCMLPHLIDQQVHHYVGSVLVRGVEQIVLLYLEESHVVVCEKYPAHTQALLDALPPHKLPW